MNRFRSTKLAIEQKPKYVFDYYVSGMGTFPMDMLRHDQCWPVGPEDVMKLDDPERNMRSIRLRSYRAPTFGRWMSFLWSVSEDCPLPAERVLQ